MKNLTDKPSKSDPTITIYKHRIVLSARACFILRITESRRVQFGEEGGRHFIYRPSDGIGYYVNFREGRSTGTINDTHLAGELAYALGGYGVYRITNNISFSEKMERLFQIITYALA